MPLVFQHYRYTSEQKIPFPPLIVYFIIIIFFFWQRILISSQCALDMGTNQSTLRKKT